MDTLEKVTLNSVNLIDQRLRLLQEELKEIETQYGPLSVQKSPEKKVQSLRYNDLPRIEPDPVKQVTIKPQITEDYLKTLQYVPDIMSEYCAAVQEPQFLNDSFDLVTPPRNTVDNSLLYEYLSKNYIRNLL